MTRLQKDAVKGLVIMALALITVGVIYAFTRNPIVSLAGLAVMGLAGFLDLFRSAEPGPVKEAEELAPPPRSTRGLVERVAIALFAAVISTFLAIAYTVIRRFSSVTCDWIVPVVMMAVIVCLLLWVRRRLSAMKRRVPKYDEREWLVLENARTAAFCAFWVLFILWSVSAGMLSNAGIWHLPGAVYTFQAFVAMWVFYTTSAISILWQEWRAGK